MDAVHADAASSLASGSGRADVTEAAAASSAAKTCAELTPAAATVQVRPIVRSCAPGLEWDVTISEDERELSATVVFKEEIWEALTGSPSVSAGSKSFRDAVSFELSEEELRVTYMGSAVLELGLPQPVDAAAAAAKLSSKLRRVIVRVPLS